MKTKNTDLYQYPGLLGEKSREYLLAWFEFGRDSIAIGETEATKNLSRRMWTHDERVLELLCEHFGITSNGADRWHALAWHLAKQHVPAMQDSDKIPARRRGRPSKKNALARYGTLGNPFNFALPGGGLLGSLTKRRGRPRDERRGEFLRGLLSRVLRRIHERGLRGRGAITTILESMIKAYAEEDGLSYWRLRKRLLPALRKDVSEAKKLFPEIAAKFPK